MSGRMVLTAAAPIEDSFVLPDETCQRLTLAQIQLATNNFSEALVIGRGGFGKVYKSLINFGSEDDGVAIKRLHSTSSQGASEFETEVKLLSKLRHGNLVSLIGYCSEGKEMVLAYEFMPNGTLEDHLHKGGLELSWLQLLKICIGAARGLDYLHTGTSTQHGVIHRDVKTSNILLDSNFAAKVSDFGLAKIGTINQTLTHVSTLVKGTFGYMDPYYYYTGKLTRKSDVYAFGVVLFEVLSGKQAVDPMLDDSLADWAQYHFKQGTLDEIINHRLMGQISKKCLKGFARIAVQCLHNQPKQRPTMSEVVVKLELFLSQERESVGSSVDDGRFINKVRYFFRGKANLMQAHAEENTSEISAQESNNQWLDFSPEKYNHPNLVKQDHTSLETLMFGEPGTPLLSWVERLKIAVGAAVGLCILHKKGRPAYIQFKTACILVDADCNARLEDSFLVDLDSYSFKTDAYYAAPEWFRYHADVKLDRATVTRQIEDGFGVKSEVYSFGVVLLEMLTGMKVFDKHRPQGKQNLVKWATPLLAHEENLGMIMDPQLQDNNNHPPKGAHKLALLVLNCVQPKPSERPSMEEIVQVLQSTTV